MSLTQKQKEEFIRKCQTLDLGVHHKRLLRKRQTMLVNLVKAPAPTVTGYVPTKIPREPRVHAHTTKIGYL
jgi:hypothetical protein